MSQRSQYLVNQSELLDDAKLFRQGVDKYREGDHAGAIQAFDQALQLHPTDADAYGHRCVARHRLGDIQGAMPKAGEAIADCQQAAALYLKQGKPKEHQYALKMLRKLQA